MNIKEFEGVVNAYPNWCSHDFNLVPPTIVVLPFGIPIAILLCKIFRHSVKCRLPLQAPLFIFVLILGVVIKNSFLKNYFQHHLKLDGVKDLLAVCFPIFALRAAFSIEKKNVFKILPLMILAALGSFLSGLMHGTMMKVVREHKSTNNMVGLIYGFVFCNTQPYFISSLLKSMETYKYLHYLLEGETIINNALSLSIMDILYSWDKYVMFQWYQVITIIVMKFLLAIPLGFILGKLTSLPVIYLKLDMTHLAIIVVGMAIISFKLADILEISPYITVTVVIFVLLYDRQKFSSIHEYNLIIALKVIETVTDMVIGTYCILQIVFGADESEIGIFHFLVLNYISVLICRFVVFTILFPVAKRLGYPYSIQTFTLILAWSSVMSTNLVCMGLILLTLPSTKGEALEVIVFILFNYFGSLLINSLAMGICIRVLCYQQISQTKVINMNLLIKHIMEIRDKAVYLLKMNRFMADVNWNYVKKMTDLENPYKNEALAISNQRGISAPACPFCNKGVSIDVLSTKSNLDVIRDTRKEIWNRMKTIIIIHHELGMVSKESMVVILKIFEHYSNEESFGVINLDKLKLCFSGHKFLDFLNKIYKTFFSFERSKILVPRKHHRRICYRIIMHKSFLIIMYIIIILSIIPIFCEYQIADWLEKNNLEMLLLVGDYFLVLIFTVEMVLNMLAYSWVYFWKDGVRTYFKSFWHILDIFALFFLCLEITLDNIVYYFELPIYTALADMFSQVRLLRLLRIFNGQFPRILNIFQSRLEMRLLNSYEIAKALRETISEFLQIMDKFIPESDFSKEFYYNLLCAKQEIFELKLKIHIQYPWMVTTVKTKQMIACCKYVMIDTLLGLKSLGYVDEIEYNSLIAAIKAKDDLFKSLKKIQPPTPNSIFFSVMWMGIEDAKIGEFLYTRSSVRIFGIGHIFANVGDFLDGLLIIIQGVLKVTYTANNIAKYISHGTIPVIDGFDLTDSQDVYETYIFPGNTVGELNFLTGRPYDCTIEAVTDVRAYFINSKYVGRALKISKSSIDSLECTMWKYSLMNVAQTVLIHSPRYAIHSVREIEIKLENAFIPDFRGFTTLALSDVIEDVLLLDGTVSDAYTNAVYKAPIHIPRAVVRLNVARQSPYAKLMLIPLPDVDNIIPLEIEPKVVEMVTTDDTRCNFFLRKKRRGPSSKFDFNTHTSRSSLGGSFASVGSKKIDDEKSITSVASYIQKESSHDILMRNRDDE